ncbi:MAG: hypothetical protein AAB693_02915 [Patescibacteria group bacterium]
MIEKIKTKKVSIDELAIMVANGFDGMNKKLEHEIGTLRDEMKEEFKNVRHEMKDMREEIVEEFDCVKTQIMETNDRIDFLAESRVTYEGHEILKSRVERIEKYIKI